MAFGEQHGYPLFLKLDKGGGGKGIEKVSEPSQAAEVFKRACSIGAMAFGSPACYIETVVERPRHIEVQFIADQAGHVVCLGERECSIQRRHQKIIEEALSPVVDEATRAKLYADTAAIVKRWATWARAPWRGYAPKTATTTSWRSTPVCRWSIR